MEAYQALARVYDRLMDEDERRLWAESTLALLSGAGVAPGGAVADLACGTGALSIPLAQAGYRVTAIDINEQMLTQARQKAGGLPIAWVRQDMTRLALHRPVAAVNCACDGVNYLTSPEAVAQCFAAVWRALLPGGFFVFDISTQEKLAAMDGELYGLDEDDVAYLWRNEMDPATRVLTMDITLFVSRGGGLFERLEETHRQRAHTHEELIEALARAGFVNVQAFSGLTGSPPQAGDLRRRYTAYRPE